MPPVNSNAAANSAAVSAPEETPPPGINFSDAPLDLAKPLQISTLPADFAVSQKISAVIEESEFRNANWGVYVLSLKDGRVIAARSAQQPFNPASVQKIITTVVGLESLGADFRWQTAVLADSEPRDGVVEGDLILRGNGAPDFDSAQIAELVTKMQMRGIRRIAGKIRGDESYFTADALGDGWIWNEAQWYYGAEASALSYNRNQVSVALGDDGKVRVAPETELVEASSAVKIDRGTKVDSYGIKRGLGDNKIFFWGETAQTGQSARVAVHNPALFAVEALRREMLKRGIEVSGGMTADDWSSSERKDVSKMVPLAMVQSKTLAEIVRETNKHSINLNAELILRTLGAKFGDTVPDENPQMRAVRGTDAAGAAFIKKFLKEKNIAGDETAIHDGSGLSRLDFISPETLGKTLSFVTGMKTIKPFIDSLPIAGVDGTLGGRLGKYNGKISAKTGTARYVNSLAGYAQKEKEVLAFAIIYNGSTGKKDAVPTIDKIVGAIMDGE